MRAQGDAQCTVLNRVGGRPFCPFLSLLEVLGSACTSPKALGQTVNRMYPPSLGGVFNQQASHFRPSTHPGNKKLLRRQSFCLRKGLLFRDFLLFQLVSSKMRALQLFVLVFCSIVVWGAGSFLHQRLRRDNLSTSEPLSLSPFCVI